MELIWCCAFDSMHFFHPFKWQCSSSKPFSCVCVCVMVDDRADIRFSITIRMLAYSGPFVDHISDVWMLLKRIKWMHNLRLFAWIDVINTPKSNENNMIQAKLRNGLKHIIWSIGIFFRWTLFLWSQENFKRNVGNCIFLSHKRKHQGNIPPMDVYEWMAWRL